MDTVESAGSPAGTPFPERLWLGDYTVSKHQLTMTYGLDDMRFSCSYWYSSEIDLLRIQSNYGGDFFEKLIFNIICFEANKLCSLKPKYLDLGKIGKHWTPELETIWKKMFFKIWGQWRYQNGFPDYCGPQVLKGEATGVAQVSPVEVKPGKTRNLCFFGGGKDSLASTTILDEMGEDYEILTYTNSIYGSADKQIKIIQGLMSEVTTKKYQFLYVYDDFVNCPILPIGGYKIEEILAAETPSGIFSSLIFCLEKGYTNLILGHQKSADKGNLVWNDEDINHQWGKSTEAEELLREYIQQQLITNVTYYSILKSLYDIGIILVAANQQPLIPLTHSCNVDKPWCKKCPKCCYVWLLYMATMDAEMVNQMFGQNLLDQPHNRLHFRQMLGLEDHTPFECVGGVDEARLCFELLRIKGVSGLAMEDFLTIPRQDYPALLQKYSAVDEGYKGVPSSIRSTYFEKVHALINRQKKPILALLQENK